MILNLFLCNIDVSYIVNLNQLPISSFHSKFYEQNKTTSSTFPSNYLHLMLSDLMDPEYSYI